tara:strand:- start:707 stop:1015 length:309 start_codon:yes stop_codon:yes gene_type:complete
MNEKSRANNAWLGAAIGALLGKWYAITNVREYLDGDGKESDALIQGIGTDYVLMQMALWSAWGVIIAMIIVPWLIAELRKSFDHPNRKSIVITRKKGPQPPN